MDVVFWVILCVGGTTVPLTLDLVRSFLPRAYRTGRLVAGWQKPVLLSMVGLLCLAGYYLFWVSVLAYSHPLRSPTTTQMQYGGVLAVQAPLWLSHSIVSSQLRMVCCICIRCAW